ncbi:MAG: NACHT domain-containing protein, partial [Cyanobacteria bacterium J06598_3]
MTSGSPLPDPEGRIVEKVTNGLIRWVPLGGSMGVLVHAVITSSFAQALVMFPVTAVTGVWAAYTENFVARCRELASDRGKQDPDRIIGLAKKADAAIRWQLSGFEGRYLKAQANACEEYTVEGYAKTGGWKLLLEEVYVPLEVSGAALFDRWPEKGAPLDVAAMESAQREELYLWQLLSQVRKVSAYRQMAILAKGGFGKTTLLRHVTYNYATKPDKMRRRHKVPVLIPFLLYLRDWRDVIAKPDAPDLPTLIREHHIPNLPEGKQLRLPDNWVQNVLREGNALVMFDGFDEIAEDQRDAVGQWISRQMGDYRQSIFILTSRPEGFEEYKNCPGAQRLSAIYVKGFSPRQRNQFIQSWYLCQERYERANRDTPTVRDVADKAAQKLIAEIETRPELTAMAENPLMLNMIASFHRFSSGRQLPDRRTDLYGDICQMQLWDRPREKYVDMLLRPKESKAILQKIALHMTDRPEPTVKLSIAELTDLAASVIAEVSEDSIRANDFIEQIKNVSELFTERDLQEYEFSHRSFQDYLAACEIADNHSVERVINNLENKWWRETILLYAELVNPSKIIEAAVALNTPTAVDVAFRCLQMGSNLSRVSSALQAQLDVDSILQAQL